MRLLKNFCFPLFVLVQVGCVASGLSPLSPSEREERVAQLFEEVREDPEALRGFFARMPKGGDLHHHASGAIPPEVLIEFAAAEGLCLPTDLDVIWSLTEAPCKSYERPASEVVESAELMDEILERWSMRSYLASDPEIDRRAAHDHFFGIFGQIGPATLDLAKLLAVGRSLAAEERVMYLESTSGWVADRSLREELYGLEWNDDLGALHEAIVSDPRFIRLRDQTVAAFPREFERADELLKCGTPEADAGCQVEVRLQQIAIRTLDPIVVFVQTVIGYELAARSPLLVGVNIVAPETASVSLRDYALHMRMHAFLGPLYPEVRRSFHAAEMTDQEARQLGATDHLALALGDASQGGADVHRIGHGVSLNAETTRDEVLRQMREERIAVELNLRSNLQLLGVEGEAHPILDYLEAGVPIALSTDDPGLMLTGMNEQFEVAASYEEIDYRTLKGFAFNSIRDSFLDSKSRTRLLNSLEESFEEFEHSILTSWPE